VQAPVIHMLREAGHDVYAVAENNPGIGDDIVLDQARKSGRTLLTFDKDFGHLVFKRGLPAPRGIILVRLPALLSWTEMGQALIRALAAPTQWELSFAVIDQYRVRITRLPEV
jgi:predicted nuclease of predicted toxin-antitoxin system